MVAFADIDAKFGTEEVGQIYSTLKAQYGKGEKDKELLWRLGRACHELAGKEADNEKKKALIIEGHGYCLAAYKQDQNSFPIVKWVAVLTGQLTEYLPTKEKIQEGFKFKEYIDKALAMDKKEHSLLHMRGRYAFGVASLSWLERKAAAVIYSTPPSAAYEEALTDFLAAYETRPDWIENIFYIAKTYKEMKNKENTKKYLKLGLALQAGDESEREMKLEMEKMMKKV